MIFLNENIEFVSQNISQVTRLRKSFHSVSGLIMIELVGQLDPHKKGYFTPPQLCIQKDLGCQQFITRSLGDRISYSGVASYVQDLKNRSSWIGEEEKVQASKIRELIKKEYELENQVKQIRADLSQYIPDNRGKIEYQDFQNYCHSQKLRANPELVFQVLSNNKSYIQVNYPIQGQDNSKILSLEQTVSKIEKSRASLKRLAERVDKFGVEWL